MGYKTKILLTAILILFNYPNFALAEDKLLQSTSLVYTGAFNLSSSPAACGGSYSPGQIAYNPANNSLFVGGGIVSTNCTGSQVGEVSIPEILSSSSESDYANIPAATWLQPYSDISNGNLFNIGPGGTLSAGSLMFQGGFIVSGSNLLGSSGSDYDATPSTTEFLSFYKHGLNLSNTSSYLGMYGLNISASVGVSTRFSNAFLANIPSAYQAQLGGSVFGGNGGRSVISTGTYGPSVVVFDPDNLGEANAQSSPDNRGPATLLLGYPGATGPEGWGSWGSSTQAVTQYFGTSDNVTGAVLPDNSRSILFFGEHSYGSCVPVSGSSPTSLSECAFPIGSGETANFGGYCYGEGTPNLNEQCSSTGGPWGPKCAMGSLCGGIVNNTSENCCYDPTGSAKGQHEYPSRLRVWAYDVGDSSGNNTSGNVITSYISNPSAPAGLAGNNSGANNLTAVKLGKLYPNDLYPYAMWNLDFPWLHLMSGQRFFVAYDSVNRKLYLSASNQPTSEYGRMPVFGVFDLNISGDSTSPASPSGLSVW